MTDVDGQRRPLSHLVGEVMVTPNGEEMGADDSEARVRAALAHMDQIAFPPLDRPAVPYLGEPTRELVDWARRFYVFVQVSHVRELLHSLLVLVNARREPAAFVVARALFEVCCHAVFIHGKNAPLSQLGDLRGAWELFHRASMGNRAMHDKREPNSVDTVWESPFRVGDTVRAMDTFLQELVPGDPKAARDMYAHLSEHSHPNMGAFSQYYRMEESAAGIRVIFGLRGDYSLPPLGEVAMALVAALRCDASLLEESGDRQLADALRSTLHGLVRPRPDLEHGDTRTAPSLDDDQGGG